MMKFELTGGAELERQLKALPEALSAAILSAALTKAAEPIRSKAEAHAPRGEGGEHLADNIVIGDPFKGEEGGLTVPIGPEHHPDDFFYGYFQEFGTAFHGAQPFMRPGYDEGIAQAVEILGSELWQAITRRAGLR